MSARTQELIANALTAHAWSKALPASLSAECASHLSCEGCDWISSRCRDMDKYDEHAQHQAAVLAALSDVAIVDVPTRPWPGQGLRVSRRDDGVPAIEFTPAYAVRRMAPSVARAFASDLLAAARFAEASDD